MQSRHLMSFVVLAILMMASNLVFAESSVVILKFERFNVDESIASAFYRSLDAEVEAHPDLTVKKGGELTIQDLVLTAGCDAPDAKCLSQLGAMVGADQLVYGSIQQSDDVVLFTIRQFDFAEGRFVREVDEATLKGSMGEIIDAIPAVIENFLYGPVGALEILVDSGSPEIFLNSEKVGRAPTLLENLPLGEHVVTLRTDSGEERTQTIILRRGQIEELSFQFGEVEEVPALSSGGPSALPGWILVGVGVAGVGFGLYQTLEVGRIDDDFAALCARPENVCEGSEAALGSPEAATQARTLADEGSTAKTLQLVGFSVGGAALAVGGFLLYRAYTHSSEEGISFQLSPRKDGFSAGLGFSF